jgi:hypothetical protein
LISDGERWPFVGRAYLNHNGSINVYLDEGVTLTGGQKLYLKHAVDKAAKAAKSEPAVAAAETIR